MIRSSSWLRRRLALFALPLALVSVPVVLANASQPLDKCKRTSGAGDHWQKLKLPVSNPTGFAIDYLSPNRMIVSSTKTIWVSDDNGCSWLVAVQLDTLAQDAGYSSAISDIVDVAYNFKGAAIATVSEGSGSQAVPHVIRSDTGGRGTWQTADTGLPSVGSPRTLAAGFAGFVIGMAQFGSDVTGGIGGLPGTGGTDPSGQVPALFYNSFDGTKWAAGATPADVGGAQAISLIEADHYGADYVEAVIAGRLWYSFDKGRSFKKSSLSGTPTALVAAGSSGVGIFGNGFAAVSNDVGAHTKSIPAISDVRSGAWRATDRKFMLAGISHVHRVTEAGRSEDVTPTGYSSSGSPIVRSDVLFGDAYYIAAGSYLYRWFDTYKPGQQPPGYDNARVEYRPPNGSLTPRNLTMTLGPRQTVKVNYALHLPKSRTPIDVYYLIDVSASMGDVIDDLKKNAKQIGVDLKKAGVDINEGVGAVGTAPNTTIGTPPDPPTDPNQKPDKPYHQPVLYKQWAPVGKVNGAFFSAVDRLQEEYYILPDTTPCNDGTHTDANECDRHIEGQLIGLQQSITGSGVSDVRLNVPVLPGQAAGFRQDGNAKRIIVLATNERFRMPPGTPVKNGAPDIAGVASLLREHGVIVLGLTGNQPDQSRADLRQIAKLTGALAPKGGVQCLHDDDQHVIAQGQPIVCEDQAGFSKVIERVIDSLEDFQNVQVAASRVSPVFRGASVAGFPKVNVKAPFDGTFTATYSCLGVAPGTYPVAIDAYLRGFKVATAVASITCGTTPVPPVNPKADPLPITQNPPAQPPPAPPAPAPAQPVTQAQTQPQAQINPQIGSAAQEQEQLQLALAQAGVYLADDDDEKVTQQAMSARRTDERVALALLGAAMLSSSIVGLAMMRRHRAQAAAGLSPAWIRRTSSR